MKYTGHERDLETGHDYMHARYYHEHLGRFLSVDLVESSSRLPTRMNRYAYASASPIVRTDPNGLTDIYIDITRMMQTESSLMGFLTVRGTDLLFATLEPRWDGNAPFTSAIPPGTYEGVRHKSPRHGETVWIKGVPNRTEILIHPGNEPSNTQGCILVGLSCGRADWINQGKKARDQLISYVDSVMTQDSLAGATTRIIVQIIDPAGFSDFDIPAELAGQIDDSVNVTAQKPDPIAQITIGVRTFSLTWSQFQAELSMSDLTAWSCRLTGACYGGGGGMGVGEVWYAY